MNQFADVLFGVALGDALGYPNENKSYKQILNNPSNLPNKLLVSDDTQLSLAVAVAAQATSKKELQSRLIENFVRWLNDPDMRGYGQTTVAAISALRSGFKWQDATVIESNGCGAVMRVAACAFLPDGTWQAFSAWQAAVTHGGPAAIASALLATALTRELLSGKAGSASDIALELSNDESLIVAGAQWLDKHPRAGSVDAAAELIRIGMKMVRGCIVQATSSLSMFQKAPWNADPSDPRYGGLGYTAQHALGCAILCVDMLPESPIESLLRATVTGGDSDTIAAITGMLLGARGNAWTEGLTNRLEPRYRNWILQISQPVTTAL